MKQFSIEDGRSANKIGIDATLLGSWVGIRPNITNILDVGCGCGIISLMLAQRCPNANIVGIDIENNTITDAIENFKSSPWNDRLHALIRDYNSLLKEKLADDNDIWPESFDLIVSNPPYFDSGVSSDSSPRSLARHIGSLSPKKLLNTAKSLLSRNGILALVVPVANLEDYIREGLKGHLVLKRLCLVKGNPNVCPKRALMEFSPKAEEDSLKADNLLSYFDSRAELSISDILKILDIKPENITIELSRGIYTEEYKRLGRPFYLKF